VYHLDCNCYFGCVVTVALIFGVLCAALICGVLLNTETVLLLLRQDPQVAKYAHDMCSLLRHVSLHSIHCSFVFLSHCFLRSLGCSKYG